MTTIYVSDKKDLPTRHQNDKYVTERNLIRAAYLEHLPFPVERVLDIGAGDGRWGAIVRETQPLVELWGVEIDDTPVSDTFDFWHNNTDFFDFAERYYNDDFGWDLIVSNPPYNLAEPMIRAAWELLVPGGTMIMLLRLAFQASIGRYEKLWNEIWPREVSVLSRRPSFYGGGTNGTDYGIYVWEKDEWHNPVGAPRIWMTSLINYERDTDEEEGTEGTEGSA